MAKKPTLSSVYSSIVGFSSKRGTYGIEIECEATSEFRTGPLKYWNTAADGSLRNYGLEFILKQPLMKSDITVALKEFSEKTSEIRFIKDSKNTSVHVHVNMQEETLTTLVNFMCLYYLFEQTLVAYSGDFRKDNLFCLTLKDADGHFSNIMNLIKGIDNQTRNALGNVNTSLKYSALNLSSLTSFGSLELRSFRGTTDTKEIMNWVNIIDDILVHARTKDLNPETLLARIEKVEASLVEEVFVNTISEIKPFFNEDDFFSAVWYINKISKLCSDWEDFSTIGTIDKSSANYKSIMKSVLERNHLRSYEQLTKSDRDSIDKACLSSYISNYGKPLRESKTKKKKKVVSKNSGKKPTITATTEGYNWAITPDASRGIDTINDTYRVNLNGDWGVGIENREPTDTSSMNQLGELLRSTERDF